MGNMHAFDVIFVVVAHARPRSFTQQIINTNSRSGQCGLASKKYRCVGEGAPRSERILSHTWRYGVVGTALLFDAQPSNVLQMHAVSRSWEK